jgi:cell wall-associated NlpC family hydrolase
MDGGGHIGIYLGGGMMIDAPRPGTVVNVRPIYNPAHWFIRYGI